MPASRATVAAAHHPHADARCAGSHPGRHRRLGDPEGQPLRPIVVDLDRHRVIDLLPDRTAPHGNRWLERHPGVELVARDRSTEYARGASLGAPRRNRSPIDGTFSLTCGRPSNAGSRAPCPVAQPAAPPWLDRSSCPARPRLCPALRRSWKRGHRPDAMAGHLRRCPPSARRRGALLAIARALGLARATVRKYAIAEAFPARLPHGAGPACLIRTSRTWRTDRRGLRERHRPVARDRVRGSPGRAGRSRLVAQHRRGRSDQAQTSLRGQCIAAAWRSSIAARTAAGVVLVQPPSGLDASDAAVVRGIEQDDTARTVTGLAGRFTRLLVRAAGKGKTVTNDQDADAAADIAAWITQARTAMPRPRDIRSGLEAYIAAVGLLSGSHGAAVRRKPGQPAQLIKRQCYGDWQRRSPETRMVLAA